MTTASALSGSPFVNFTLGRNASFIEVGEICSHFSTKQALVLAGRRIRPQERLDDRASGIEIVRRGRAVRPQRLRVEPLSDRKRLGSLRERGGGEVEGAAGDAADGEHGGGSQ